MDGSGTQKWGGEAGLLQLRVRTEVSRADCTRTYVSQARGLWQDTCWSLQSSVLCSVSAKNLTVVWDPGQMPLKTEGRSTPCEDSPASSFVPKSSWGLGFPSADPNLTVSDLGLNGSYLSSARAISGFPQVSLSSLMGYQMPCGPFPQGFSVIRSGVA